MRPSRAQQEGASGWRGNFSCRPGSGALLRPGTGALRGGGHRFAGWSGLDFGVRVELEPMPEEARQFAVAVQRFHALQVVRPWYGSHLVMDKFWSIFAMPIGVALCFGPALIVWWLTKDKEAPSDDKSGKSH